MLSEQQDALRYTVFHQLDSFLQQLSITHYTESGLLLLLPLPPVQHRTDRIFVHSCYHLKVRIFLHKLMCQLPGFLILRIYSRRPQQILSARSPSPFAEIPLLALHRGGYTLLHGPRSQSDPPGPRSDAANSPSFSPASRLSL